MSVVSRVGVESPTLSHESESSQPGKFESSTTLLARLIILANVAVSCKCLIPKASRSRAKAIHTTNVRNSDSKLAHAK